MGLNITNTVACLAACLVTATPAAANTAATKTATAETAGRYEHDTVPGLQKPPMSAADLVTMPRLGAPIATRSGDRAIYTVTYTDPETLERRPAHYLIDLTRMSEPPRAIELGVEARSLAFGPDDALYFLSDADANDATPGRSRLWRAAMDAGGTFGEPGIVAQFSDTDIAGFMLSPKGNRVALLAQLPRECRRFDCAEQHDVAERGSGRLYDGDGGFYRHWDQWIRPGVFNRVFVFDIAGGRVTGGGVPIDGLDPATGVTGNTPTMPFGGPEDLAWAPDGSGMYFTLREANAGEPGSTDLDIYYSDLSGAAPRVLTGANEATDTAPAPSPDGRQLAYIAMSRPGYESDRTIVQLRDLSTGETRALTQDIDLSFGSLAWSPDGSAIYATAQSVLDTPAFRIDPRTGEATELNLIAGNEAHIGAMIPLPGDRLLFTRDSIGVPPELYLAKGSAKGRPLTNIVTSRMGEMASTVTTRFSFAGAEGDTVHGQITRLENQTGSIPAILYIHGGPQGSFNDAWSSRWNPRVLASQGYAVISVDFHGSTGYGQDFADAINRDWGGKPLEDLQKGFAAALERDPQIDGSRACAMGASYGGYMVNWIAGNWPDRFDCLVQHDGLFDLRSFYYSTEELWFPRWDFGGSYADQRELYERWNPVNYVANWRTPMLVIAGEQDFRVPYTQGLQSFGALQERGIESQLLVFPDENHWVLGAANSLQWHQTVFAWLDRWTGSRRAGDAAE